VVRGYARRPLALLVFSRVLRAHGRVFALAGGRGADAAELFVADGILAAMSRFNRKDDEVKE
jgi:hypothetical protein